MTLRYLTTVVIALSSSLLLGQDDRLEVNFMNCVYEHCEDNGQEIKSTIKSYEQLLVDEGILRDATGDAYVALFEKMIKANEIDFAPSKTFQAAIRELEEPQEGYRECQLELMTNSGQYIDKSQRLSTVLDSLRNSAGYNPASFATGVLNTLDATDFELEFYKLSMLIMIESISFDNNSGLMRQIPPPPPPSDQEDFSAIKILNVHLNHRDRIYIGEAQISLEELTELVHAFVAQNRSQARISLKVAREASYEKYNEVQNTIVAAIEQLREDYALKTYSKSFDVLAEEEQIIVKMMFPIKISERK